MSFASGSGQVFSVRLRGSVLVSGGDDKMVRLWSLKEGDGECVTALTHGATVKGIAISKVGWVVSAGGKGMPLTIWRAEGGAPK
jgi:WD40 repeat protein